MSGEDPDDRNRDDRDCEKLERELARARAEIRTLEGELAETNEGMIALTLELEKARKRYQKIFESSNDAILLIDTEQDAIHEANPRAYELFGYSREALLSLSASELFPDESDPFRSFADVVVSGWASGFTCRTKDGKKLRIEMSASVFELDDRSVLLAAIRDVTERKRREQQLQVLNRIFRHNLRNDGNVIQGHADILHGELAESTLQGSATAIRRSITEILGVSKKVRRIQDVLDREYVSPAEISGILEEQRRRLLLAYPEATIDVDVETSAADVAVGRRLGPALYETVENTIKHSDESNPIATVSVGFAEDGERLAITVADRGPGIPPYERNVVLEGEESPLKHGSGVGLWFVQWVVGSLGGELTIRDNSPRGTRLSMVVPAVGDEVTRELRSPQTSG